MVLEFAWELLGILAFIWDFSDFLGFEYTFVFYKKKNYKITNLKKRPKPKKRVRKCFLVISIENLRTFLENLSLLSSIFKKSQAAPKLGFSYKTKRV